MSQAVSPAAFPAPAADPPGSEPPLLVLEPRRGWVPLDVAEIWGFRDLLWTLAGRDIKIRYKQTVLGVAWVVLQPLVGAGILTFVFGLLGDMPRDEGVPYFALSFAGMLGWNAFSQTLLKSSDCLVGNAALVSKVYFPRVILPLSTMVSTVLDFAVGLGMMAVILLVFTIAPGWPLLLLPVWLAMLLLVALGVGLWACSLMVSYRDVRYVLPVAVNFMLFGSPVAYSLAALDTRLGSLGSWAGVAEFVYMLNPVAAVLEAFRWSLLGGSAPPVGWLIYSGGFAAAAFFAGALTFKRMEKRFADVI
ncbi:MAG: ABC transporter permease [Planctomycetota bacterium]